MYASIATENIVIIGSTISEVKLSPLKKTTRAVSSAIIEPTKHSQIKLCHHASNVIYAYWRCLGKWTSLLAIFGSFERQHQAFVFQLSYLSHQS